MGKAGHKKVKTFRICSFRIFILNKKYMGIFISLKGHGEDSMPNMDNCPNAISVQDEYLERPISYTLAFACPKILFFNERHKNCSECKKN